MRFRAVIFDLDGVLCSTDEYHYRAWKSLADELGIPFDRRDNDALRGVSRMASLELILAKSSRSWSEAEKESLAARKNERYRALLAGMSPADLDPAVAEMLRTLRRAGLRLAVGSSSRNAPFILDRLGLGGFFDAVCDGSCITRAKPDPEVFLKAAEMLALPPVDCLVVEDAASGAAAARAGGFPLACVGDAAAKGLGDRNLSSAAELVGVCL